jgi:glutamyl-tRNA reductase
LQAAMDAIVQTELRRSQYRLRTLTPDQLQAIQQLLRRIANRILQPAIWSLKQAARQGDSETIARICEIFGVARLPLLQAGDDEASIFPFNPPDLMIT